MMLKESQYPAWKNDINIPGNASLDTPHRKFKYDDVEENTNQGYEVFHVINIGS
jgi:hypothetical protein